MEKRDRSLARAQGRLEELWKLRARFQGQDEKPSLEWMVDCTAVIAFLMEKEMHPDIGTDLLVTLATAMWQAGYEAAPKLEFVLQEGAGG